MAKKPTLGQQQVTVQIVRRDLLQPVPGSAEPRHDYTVLFTTRASVQSKTGVSPFAQVMVGNELATHVFTIRYTTIPFDIRCRLRDAVGTLYRILSIDNVDLGNITYRINCAMAGADSVEAAR